MGSGDRGSPRGSPGSDRRSWSERIARVPVNQLMLMKLLVNQAVYAQGLHATEVLGTVFDGIARHTAEGYAFQQRAAEAGFREAVRERDEPFGDAGRSTVQRLSPIGRSDRHRHTAYGSRPSTNALPLDARGRWG